MVDSPDGRQIVALLDRPSPESFGICPLIVKRETAEFYEVLGLATGVNIIPSEKYDRQYGGHILRVEAQLPKDLPNPVALWLGTGFCLKAESLGAPAPPKTDATWLSPLGPHQERGRYKLETYRKAYSVLDRWVTATGIEALKRDDNDLARLMNWALPFSPTTQAALYFTAEDRQRELEFQLKLKRDSGETVTIDDLIQLHKRTRSELLP